MARPGKPPAGGAYERAMGLLVRREHSRRELARKLSAKGEEPAEAAEALDRLGEQGFQSDERFADTFARGRARSGRGPAFIRAELAGKGVDRGLADAAIEASGTDWQASARAALGRRFPPEALADPARRRKAIEFLLRRGFAQDQAYAAVRAAPDDDETLE